MSTLALLPNLAGGDGLLILLIVLLLFGAKRLPELAKGLGSAVREFSKAKDEIEHELTRPPTPPTPMQPQIEPPRATEVRKEADPHAVVVEEVHDTTHAA
jgi:sec-independent protein translocase protein TatA